MFCNATYGSGCIGMYTNRVLMKGMCVSHYCAWHEACIDGQKFSGMNSFRVGIIGHTNKLNCEFVIKGVRYVIR